jgi:hypothetical protein
MSQYACYSTQLLGCRKRRNLRFGVVRSVGDVESYFLYKQVNPSTELTSNAMGQCTSWEVASRLRSPGIPRLLAFFSVTIQSSHWFQPWDGCTLLYGLTAYFIAPILIMDYPTSYQVALPSDFPTTCIHFSPPQVHYISHWSHSHWFHYLSSSCRADTVLWNSSRDILYPSISSFSLSLSCSSSLLKHPQFTTTQERHSSISEGPTWEETK